MGRDSAAKDGIERNQTELDGTGNRLKGRRKIPKSTYCKGFSKSVIRDSSPVHPVLFYFVIPPGWPCADRAESVWDAPVHPLAGRYLILSSYRSGLCGLGTNS